MIGDESVDVNTPAAPTEAGGRAEVSFAGNDGVGEAPTVRADVLVNASVSDAGPGDESPSEELVGDAAPHAALVGTNETKPTASASPAAPSEPAIETVRLGEKNNDASPVTEGPEVLGRDGSVPDTKGGATESPPPMSAIDERPAKEPTADSSTPSVNTRHGEVGVDMVTLKRTTVEYYDDVGLFGFVHVERNGLAKVYGQRFPTAGDPSPPGWKQIEALTRVSTKSVLEAWSQDGLTNSAATATMETLSDFAGTDFRATEVADGERTVVELVPVSAGILVANEIVSLRRFLGHEHGVTELRYQPSVGGRLTGYFDSESALLEVASGCRDCTLSMGVQPRPRNMFERAPNELRPEIEESDEEVIDVLTAVLLQVRADAVRKAADEVAQNIAGAPPLLALRGGEAFLAVAVPPLAITSATRDEIMLRIDELAAQVSKLAGEGVTISVVPKLSSFLDVNGLRCAAINRAENARLGGFLAKPWDVANKLPPRVLELLNEAPNGRLAKLFKGQGKIGIDSSGAETELTGDNYDVAFLKELSKQSKGPLSRDDFASAVWNRPGWNARQRGKRRLADLVNAELKRTTVPKARALSSHERTTAVSRPDSAPPGLAGALWKMYFEPIEISGQPTVKKRQGVPLSDKGDFVLGNLAYQQASFFHYADTKESSFVLNGAQHTIDFDDPNYDAWFNKVIRLFGKRETDGKALTAALDTGCRNHPACIKVQRSRWGHFDHEKGIVYLCFDPAQAEMLRVSPAVEGKPVVEVVPNGTDDILLRCPRLRDRAFVYAPGSDLRLFRELVHSQQSLSELDRLASTAFNLACLMPDRVQRPIKHHLGAQGGGKTSAASDLEHVLYGQRRYSDFSEPQALWNMVSSGGPIVTQDNAETSVRRAFANDYRLMATGGAREWRKLYTNKERVKYLPNGTLVLTSIEGMTAPEDLERVFEFAFSAENKHERSDNETRCKDLESNADAMLSALLDVMSTGLLPNFQARLAETHAFIRRERPGHSKERFNEFCSLMLLWTEAIGQALWDAERGERTFDARELFLEFVDAQDRIHKQNRVESDTAVGMLDAVRRAALQLRRQGEVSLRGVQVTTKGSQVEIGPVTTAALFNCVSGVAKDVGLMGPARPFDNPRQLGQRLAASDKSGTLAAAGWQRQCAGTVHDATPVYIFRYRPRGFGSGSADGGPGIGGSVTPLRGEPSPKRPPEPTEAPLVVSGDAAE